MDKLTKRVIESIQNSEQLTGNNDHVIVNKVLQLYFHTWSGGRNIQVVYKDIEIGKIDYNDYSLIRESIYNKKQEYLSEFLKGE